MSVEARSRQGAKTKESFGGRFARRIYPLRETILIKEGAVGGAMSLKIYGCEQRLKSPFIDDTFGQLTTYVTPLLRDRNPDRYRDRNTASDYDHDHDYDYESLSSTFDSVVGGAD